MKRITYLGRQVWPQPRTQGRYSSFTIKFKKFLRRSALVCALGWVVYGSYQLGVFDQNRTLIAHADSATSSMTVAAHGKSLRELQDDALTKLSYGCEVKGVPVPQQEGKITFDSNHLPSIGLFQFQQATVVSYVQKRDGRTIGYAEANRIASTKSDAWELARWIAFTSHIGTVPDWFNCSNKEFRIGGENVQLRDYIAFINQI